MECLPLDDVGATLFFQLLTARYALITTSNSQHPMRQLQSRQAGLRQTLKGCELDLQKPNLNAGANYQQHRRSGDFSIGVDTMEHPENPLSGNGKSRDADVQINS